MKKLVLLFMLLIFSINSLSAQRVINGVVVNSKSEPFIGATVSEKGLENNTLTDVNGQFQLVVSTDTLYIYYGQQDMITYSIKGQDTVKIIVNEPLQQYQAPSVIVSDSYIHYEGETTTTLPISFVNKLIPGNTVDALNTIPGLHMQSGGFNTNKLSIRGIGGTSQFSTSDVKTFYNNIPLHSSIGESAIEDFGLHMANQIEVIKGITGSQHEAGFGGAIIIKNKNVRAENRSEMTSSNTIGQWGHITSQNQIKIGRTNSKNAHNIALYHSYVSDDGYRDNNQFDRNNVTLNYTFNRKGKMKITTLLNRLDLKAFIPSSLNNEDYKITPSNAAFTWGRSMGNEDYNRSIVGINIDYEIDHQKSMSHTAYSQSFNSSELRPFNTIDETSRTIGLKGNYKYKRPEYDEVYTFGYRLQTEKYDFELFETDIDTKGNLFDGGNEKRALVELFAHLASDINEKWSYKLGLNSQYANISSEGNKIYNKAYILPEVTVTYRPTYRSRLYLTSGRGINYFKPDQAILPDGSYSKNLLPSVATNLAIGSKGSITDHLRYRGEIYHIWVSNLITTDRDETNQAINSNDGNANYSGVELALSYNLLSSQRSRNRNIKIDFLYSLMNNKYRNFVNDEMDYSNNKIPGAPQQTLSTILSGNIGGFFGNLRYQFVDSYHMRDDNTIKSDAYQLLNATLGYRIKVGKWNITPRIELINLADEKYASMTLVNASSFGGNAPRYYYAGRPRHVLGSIVLGYGF